MNAAPQQQQHHHYGHAPDLWGKARREPKFRHEDGGYIRLIRDPKVVLKMGPYGRWVPV